MRAISYETMLRTSRWGGSPRDTDMSQTAIVVLVLLRQLDHSQNTISNAGLLQQIYNCLNNTNDSFSASPPFLCTHLKKGARADKMFHANIAGVAS
eukprot:SAG31_NODE_21950_length_537_cov_0.965753_2_plen_95_part_01